MDRVIKLDNVDHYNSLYGLETLHPLVSVVDLTKATKSVNHIQMTYGLYALFLKGAKNCDIKYGRQHYDYQEGTIVCFAPGQTAGIWTTFDEWDKISSFDYTMSVNEEKDFSPVYDDLSIDYNTTDTGIVASVTNNGESPADFVWMDVVYLKDGEMVNFSELSFMDDNQELQPGTTLSDEGTCYSDSGVDDVVIAINGRK